MNGRRLAAGMDLLLVAGLAAVGLVVSVVPDVPDWLRAAALLPLVLFLPGYAIASALFANQILPGEERLVYSVAFSVSATALGGVALQVLIGLDRTAWTLLLASLTISIAVLASVRRSRSVAINAESPSPRLVIPGVVPVTALLAAGAIGAGAIAIASSGVRSQRDDYRFTSLWIVPSASGETHGRGDTDFTVGISNHGRRGFAYTLRVRQGRGEIGRWQLRLPAGQSWNTRVKATPGNGGVVAALFRGAELYRRVAIGPRGRH